MDHGSYGGLPEPATHPATAEGRSATENRSLSVSDRSTLTVRRSSQFATGAAEWSRSCMAETRSVIFLSS